MKLSVKLFGYFRDDRFVTEVLTFPPGTTVHDVVGALGIEPEEIGIAMLNSRHCQLHAITSENDMISLFPVISGG